MLLTDRNGPRSFEPSFTGSRKSLSALRFSVVSALFSLFALLPSAARAQDPSNQQNQGNQSVAEAARQERARKQEQQKSEKHVYTNEDLKRAQILTPEDQARVEARKNDCPQKKGCAPSPAQNSPAALDADSKSARPALGEIARQLRQQKELDALKPKQSEPFHLSIGESALASPVLPEHSVMHPPVPPVLRPEARNSETRGHVLRRDPFTPVPVPRRPRVPLDGRSQLLPARRPQWRAFAPATPKISPLRPPENFVTPAQPARPTPDDSPSAKPAAPALRIQPVHPSWPTKSHRTKSVAPGKIFPAPPPTTSLAVPRLNPAPVERLQPKALGAQPVAPTVRSSERSSNGKVIRVQPGDSLWKLARRNLGHGSLWATLLAANPAITDPHQLPAGAVLIVPAVSAAARLTAPTTPITKTEAGRKAVTVKVQKGDTLWTLAQSNLGRATNWRCLAAANPSISNPDRILAGQQLSIPAACHTSPTETVAKAK